MEAYCPAQAEYLQNQRFQSLSVDLTHTLVSASGDVAVSLQPDKVSSRVSGALLERTKAPPVLQHLAVSQAQPRGDVRAEEKLAARSGRGAVSKLIQVEGLRASQPMSQLRIKQAS